MMESYVDEITEILEEIKNIENLIKTKEKP